jgi:signal transduction histidine kinase/ligand-binding sensor domain-containing protein
VSLYILAAHFSWQRSRETPVKTASLLFAPTTSALPTLWGYRQSASMPGRPPVSARAVVVVLAAALGHFLPASVSYGAAAGDFVVRGWRAEDGLPESTVTAICQTRDGYIWLGTYGGLVRFDGLQFTLLNHDTAPELRDDNISCLYEADDGTLWIGHGTGEVTRYHRGRVEPARIPHSSESFRPRAFAADESGDLWAFADNGLLLRIRDGLKVEPTLGTASGIALLARTSEGRIWVSRRGQLSLLEHGRLNLDEPAQMGVSGYVHGLCASHDGGVWVLCEQRLRKWKDRAWVADLGNAPWGMALVDTFLETRTEWLVAGTASSGLFCLPLESPGQVLHFCQTNLFSTDWIIATCEDREGGLWVGTGGGGLELLRRKRVQTATPPDRWRGRPVLTVCPGQGGSLWVGAEGAGLYHYNYLNGAWQNFGDPEKLHEYVWSVAEDARGDVWAGTWSGGLFVLRSNVVQSVPIAPGAPPPITALLPARQGGLWLGTANGLVRYQDGQTNWFRSDLCPALRNVRTILEDREGNVWFGSGGNGIGCLQPDGRIRQLAKRDGLASDFVQCLYAAPDGALWIGTSGAGLCRYKAGRFATVGRAQGLPHGHICTILEDGLGFLWLSSRGGIFRVAKAELDRCADGLATEVSCLAYGLGDGLPTLACSAGLQPAGCKTPDGRLWFPTAKGLVVVDPHEIKTGSVPPPVVLEAVLLDDHVVLDPAASQVEVVVPPGRHRLEFQYAGLSFVAPERVRYKYRIAGLEDEWVDAGTKRSVNYSHLPAGSFRFQVIAGNSDGLWNEIGASAAVRVRPFFWQTWWFRLLGAIALISGTAAVFWYVGRRRLHRRLELSERQRAIEAERARIARDIHDDLGSHLTRITMLSESARSQLDRPAEAGAGLMRIYDTARELTRAMDETVWAVNPRHDTVEGLANYLEKFALDFLGAAGIRCRLDFPETYPPLPLTSEFRHNLFLAFKEALHNVVKHAAAPEVAIALRVGADALELAVKDDGRGFEPGQQDPTPDRVAGGNGLDNMHRRLQQLQGTFEIHSAAGKGTEVVFRIPIAR